MRKITKKSKEEMLELLSVHYGEVGTALVYETPFQLLVATALAAQTTDLQVNKVTANLFRDYPDPYAMKDLTQEDIIPYIQSVGLYKNKAKHLVSLVGQLLEEYQGEVPRTREALMSLAGVGRKTANVVLAVAFGIPAMAVDTHVFRVSQRMGLAKGKTPDEIEDQLCKLIPQSHWLKAHHWLIWHGRKICKAQKPLCDQCPLNALCPSAFKV